MLGTETNGYFLNCRLYTCSFVTNYFFVVSDDWRLRSRVQAPLLRPKNVANYLPKVDNATLKFVNK